MGRFEAYGKVCPRHSPFGQIQGNVFHDNRQFGLYVDNQESSLLGHLTFKRVRRFSAYLRE